MSVRLTLGSDPKHLAAVRDFVRRMVHLSPMRGENVHLIVQAVDEAVANVMEHGYKLAKDYRVEVEFELERHGLTIHIRDAGPEFNPLPVNKDVDINQCRKSDRPRGLGIWMMRKIMDDIRYERVDGVINQLTLVKRKTNGTTARPSAVSSQPSTDVHAEG